MTEEASQYLKLLQSIYLFKKASEDQVQFTLDGASVKVFEKDTEIFSQNKPAADFYIVLTGSVELFQIKKNKLYKMGAYGVGDVFGFEMLEYENKCLSTALVKEKTRLLVIDRSHMKQLLQKIPTLNQDLKILYESYLLNLQTPLSWKNDEEVVYFIARRHWMHLLIRLLPLAVYALISLLVLIFLAFFRFPGLSTPMIVLGADILLVFGLFVWLLADWSNDYSILTNQRVLFQEKVILLYDSRQESPLNAILSVSSTTDYFGRLLSYGDVMVRTYAGSIELPKVSNPRQVAALIETVLARVKIGQVKTEKEQVEELIRNKLGRKAEQEALPSQKPAGAPQKKSGQLFSRLNEMFKLKLEKGEVTIYRKHWFILLGKIWLPTVLLLGLLGLTIFRLLNHLTFLSLNAFLGLVFLTALLIGGWWIYNFVDWQNDQFVVTPEQLVDVDKKPLGKEERRAAPLKNVLSIEFERLGIIGLFLNYGTVYIKVGETTLTFDHVFNPADVQRDLFKRLAVRDQKEKQVQKMASQEHVADWIAAYHRVVEETNGDVSTAPALEED